MANLLLDCLRLQFAVPDPDLATPGDFCLIPGEQITEDIDPINGEDICCLGRGWVRIGDEYPSSNFPTADTVVKSPCFPLAYAVELEIGLLGCYMPGGEPHMASCAQLTDIAAADATRIQKIKSALCCFGEQLQNNPKTRGRLWTQTSIVVQGPRGNCISRVGTILVQVPKCC